MENAQVMNTPMALQQFIAMHTSRIEGYTKAQEHTQDENLKNLFGNLSQQAEQFQKKLMEELTQYGDATHSNVNKENEFFKIWDKAVSDFADKPAFTAAEVCRFVEKTVVETYRITIENTSDLPETTHDTLLSQQTLLEANIEKMTGKPDLENPSEEKKDENVKEQNDQRVAFVQNPALY
ncbi:MAG: DUF2383 domain-containing protein [Verrucomicrobia bacterium]|nr:DUF2383 domain-containing protein [Cytophagales bacterium]